MRKRERRTGDETAEYLRRLARETRALADEFDARADQYDYRTSPGTPDDGHTFRIAVSERASTKVVSEDGHRDAERFTQLHNWVEVRAWDLSEALVRAAGLPLDSWFDEEDD